jgi:hypothetical protein
VPEVVVDRGVVESRPVDHEHAGIGLPDGERGRGAKRAIPGGVLEDVVNRAAGTEPGAGADHELDALDVPPAPELPPVLGPTPVSVPQAAWLPTTNARIGAYEMNERTVASMNFFAATGKEANMRTEVRAACFAPVVT